MSLSESLGIKTTRKCTWLILETHFEFFWSSINANPGTSIEWKPLFLSNWNCPPFLLKFSVKERNLCTCIRIHHCSSALWDVSPSTLLFNIVLIISTLSLCLLRYSCCEATKARRTWRFWTIKNSLHFVNYNYIRHHILLTIIIFTTTFCPWEYLWNIVQLFFYAVVSCSIFFYVIWRVQLICTTVPTHQPYVTVLQSTMDYHSVQERNG